jgi:hypothetical protein|tara:strand:+ start:20 stop:292 length:273 start_codon:yes stop_codon:yes gene_type:complete
MIAEGLFILSVSLSGDYTDMEYVGNFIDCPTAMVYYDEHCNQYKAASCLLKEYSLLPANHIDVNPFDFESTAPQSCGFVGVDTRTFTNDK